MTGRWALLQPGVTFNLVTCCGGRGMRSKARPCQLMTPLVTCVVSRARGWDVSVVVRRMCCSARTTNEVSYYVSGDADMALSMLYALWPCRCRVFIMGYVLSFRWTSGRGQPLPHTELASFRHRMVWCGCGLAPPFRYSLRPIEQLKYRHTP